MFGRTYYHDTLRKYVILFGTLFNDIWINREDSAGNVKQSLKVPLSYGPREKFLARIEGIDGNRDPLEQPFSIVLPRMGFEITGFQYAPERKLSTRQLFTDTTSDSNVKKKYMYNPVPYDIQFSLSIFVKNTTDGTRIVEQILPFFTPEWTSTVQLVDDSPIDIKLDIPLVLNGTNQDDVYEGSFEERRALIWQLDFTMKGFFFGPVYKQNVINLANTQIFDATLYTDIDDAPTGTNPELSVASRVLNQPGLLADGSPTTYSEFNAVRALGTATIAGGEVTGVTLSEQGLGYTANATVTFSDSPQGTANTITLTQSGVGYTGPSQSNVATTTTSGSGTGLTLDVGGSGGLVSAVINQPGSGYAANDTVTVNRSGSGTLAEVRIDTIFNNTVATANVVVSDEGDTIIRVDMEEGGTGYTDTPTVTFSTPDLQSVARHLIDADDNYGQVSVIDEPWPDSD